VPVVHHDPEVRVANGHAPIRALAQMSWAEVARIELAPGITIPSLREVLTAVGDRATVYVELKGRNSEEATLELIARSSARCAVHSFDHAAVIRAARLAPAVRRGILFDAYPDDIDAAMRASAALDVWPEWKLIDAPLVERVHAGGGRVIAWTVNATAAAEELIRLGVDGLCGDDVRILPK
jgi:glycerophosphoryl diester phosphodiesterase